MGGRWLCVSASMGRWGEYQEAFARFRAEAGEPPFEAWRVPAEVREAQGALLLVDWEAREVVARRALPMPQGLWCEEGALWVALRGTHELVGWVRGPGGLEVRRVSHPWIANPHTLERSGEGRFLVSSSATDQVFEVDEAGHLGRRWCAWERGFGARPDGAPFLFDPARDHRRWVTVAADHAAHPNSALLWERGLWLITLYHQGVVVEVEPSSGATRVVLEGLLKPHALRRAPWGLTVADSVRGQVVKVGRGYEALGRLGEGLGWVQDARWGASARAEGSVWALSNRHLAASAPGERNRIVELDAQTGACLGEMALSGDEHLFSVEVWDEAQAKAWREVWA